MSSLVSLNDPFTGASATFSGCDTIMIGVCDNTWYAMGEMSQLSLSIQREKWPYWVMGRVDPNGIARGKRAISGTLTAVTFDESVLIKYNIACMRKIIDERSNKSAAIGYTSLYNEPYMHMNDPSTSTVKGKYLMQGVALDTGDVVANTVSDLSYYRVQSAVKTQAKNASGAGFNAINTGDDYAKWVNYADQLFPFDIVVLSGNETGALANFVIYGVEFTSEALTIGINDHMIEQPYNFIARGWRRIKPGWLDRVEPVVPEQTSPISTGVYV